MDQPSHSISEPADHTQATSKDHARPIALPVSIDQIPQRLRALGQWVCWRYEYQPKRNPKKPYTKVPYSVLTRRRASSTAPEMWTTFEEALAGYQKNPQTLDGIGMVVCEHNHLVGVDLDHCRDPDTGEIAGWAQAIIDRLQTYTEVSPGGEGLRLWLTGRLPDAGRKRGHIEMYDSGRFLTVTGCHLAGTPTTVEARQAELDALHAEVFSRKAPAAPPTSGAENGSTGALEDDQLLEKALAARNGQKFAQLWGGDTLGYPSASEADLALCRLLAFYTQEAAQVDRLFRRSKLYRDKWDELHGDATYGQRTIRTALGHAGERWTPKPTTASYSSNGNSQPPPPESNGEEAATAARAPDDIHLTDRGNGLRLVRACGADLHYIYRWRKWLAWQDGRWVMDDLGMVETMAKKVIAELYGWAETLIKRLREQTQAAGALPLDDATQRQRQEQMAQIEAVLKWALKSEDARRIHAMLDMAHSEPGIPLMWEQLDADPMLLNVANGTVDLKTGRMRQPRRQDLLTKRLDVAYDPRATCPRWQQFLHEIMNKNQDLIDYLQRAVGYSLTGSVQEQVIFFLYGTGANGKSTFVNTLLALLGDYAMQALPELLLVRRGEQHPTERADLFRKRFVATVEVEAGKRLAEALVKLLTGGERVRARRMREDFWEFDPTHKLWLAANHKPLIKGTDYAIWRRIRLIPFTMTIPDNKKDPNLLDKLKAELPGILRWAVDGCRAWQQHGLQAPSEVIAAGEAYQREMDMLGQFLDECCIVKPDNAGIKTQSSVLHQAYCEYSGDEMTAPMFASALIERGFTKFVSGGRMYWRGIGLFAPSEPGRGQDR
jgi:putative DNA primase/helicase